MNLLCKLSSTLTESWFPAFAGMTNVGDAVAPTTTFGPDTQDDGLNIDGFGIATR